MLFEMQEIAVAKFIEYFFKTQKITLINETEFKTAVCLL